MSRRKHQNLVRTEAVRNSKAKANLRARRVLLVIGTIGMLLLGFVLFFRWTNNADDRVASEGDSVESDTNITKQPTQGTPPVAKSSGEGMSNSATVPILALSPEDRVDDPHQDGWSSEVFSQQASKQLKSLGALLADEVIHEDNLMSIVTVDFSCEPLRPEHLFTVFQDGAIKVERAKSDVGDGPLPERVFEEPAGLAEALTRLVSPLQTLVSNRTEFKIFRVESWSNAVITHQYVTLAGRCSAGSSELHATWVIRWKKTADDAAPRMMSIAVENFEQVTTVHPSGPFYVDCTASILDHNACYREQFLRGFNHWLERSQDKRFNYLLGNPGLAIGDVNNDGLDDLYVCQEAGLPNRLFVQQADGTAEDVSQQAGVDWLENSKCALLVDLDNDSDQDLAVAINGGVVLAANEGRGRFVIRTVLDSNDDILSLTAADYDLDGRLDLYVGVYYPSALPDGVPEAAIAAASAGTVYHDANNGGANSLFRNETKDASDWRFNDVTQKIGLDNHNQRFTLAAAWEDFDNDGDLDLYVANDFGRNNLYRNDVDQKGRRQFVDVAGVVHAEDSASGMSVTWSDYNRDGRMDVYISNMFSAAGNRIAFQEQFKPEASPVVRSRIQRFARGNTLLRNTESGTFSDVSKDTGLTMGRWAWSSNFVDLNNDSWDDLLVANGYITTDDSHDL